MRDLRSLPAHAVSVVLALGVLVGCASDDGSARNRGTAGSAGTFGNAGSAATAAGIGSMPLAGTGTAIVQPLADAGALDPDAACATVRAETELAPVHLAFAFDVSGSMGKGDEEWHDRALKWDPVVAATRAFFSGTAAGAGQSTNLLASLTFFPADGDEDERCDAAAYEEPAVAMTALPSDTFSAAIAAIEPENEDDWRGGTPTLFAVLGVAASVHAYREDHAGHYAIVLVTDGYPQGCDDDADTIAAVVDEVTLARDAEIDTYVIGVANPPIDDAPDTVSDLHAIAAAGGSEQAFLIDTGNPELTVEAFEAAVSTIRAQAIACSLAIPAPPDGRELDKERVAVTYASGAGAPSTLTYDPDCAGAMSWHYDDPSDPRAIELCEEACETVQADPAASLGVAFACEQLFELE